MSSVEIEKDTTIQTAELEISSSEKATKTILNLVVSVVSILLVFALAEFATRVLSSKGIKKQVPLERPKEFYLSQDAVTMRGNHFRSNVQTENYFNIAIVGDSFTFGPGLQTYDTFSSRLDWMLNLGESEKKVDVINYGTPGASTRDEVALVDKAIEGGANLIILEITLNDAQEQSLKKEPDDFKIPGSLGSF